MKAKTISKRVLSVILCTVMLFSCWVFTAPQADAATAGTYSYSFRMYLVDNDNADCDDNDGVHVYINTKNINGNNDTTKQIEVPGGGKSSTWKGVIQGKNDSTESGTTSAGYFPISVTVSIDFDGGGWRGCKFKWILSSGGTAIYTSDTCSMSGANLFSHEKKTSSWNIDSSKYPVATTTSVGGGSTSVNVPTNGTSTNYSSAFSAGTVKDQYGVNWHQDATLSSNKPNGTGFSSNKISVTSGCNRASDYTVTITATCGSASATKTCTIKTFDYIVDFVDHDGTNLKHQTGIDYNGSATAPSSPSRGPDDTNHYAFKSWSGTYTNLTTGAQTKTITATYTGTAHSGWTYSEISGDHTNHTKKCGSCTYSTTATHTYGTPTITFADDGKTATARRTCTTAGCGHTETKSLSMESGGGITSVVQTPATCLVKGTTRYTATVTFTKVGSETNTATLTKDVQDINALGHSWGAWRSHSATEHIRTCQRTGCNATETSAHTYDADPSYTSNGDGKNNTHYYACTTAGCDYQNTSQHTWDEGEVTTQPTCTTAGVKTYHCTAKGCTGTYTEEVEARGHDWSGAWSYYSETQHIRTCQRAGCDATQTDDHTYTAYTIDTPEDADVLAALEAAHFDSETQCYRYCTVCKNVEIQDHNYTHTTTKQPTCTETGVETYTCENCHVSYTVDLPIIDHNWQLIHEAVELGQTSRIYYQCSMCKKYTSAEYNSTTQEYVPQGTPQSSKPSTSKTVTMHSPEFNTFDASGADVQCDYNNRPASLRVRQSEIGESTQAMRFAGAIDFKKVSADISFAADPAAITSDGKTVKSLEEIHANIKTGFADDCLIDFGYVYTQARYITETQGGTKLDWSKLQLGGSKIARMSVVANNYGKAAFNGSNWKGVTYDQTAGLKYLTFNLVIGIKNYNYPIVYVACPYIVYKFHGEMYVLYDRPIAMEEGEEETQYVDYFSHDSVLGLANKVKNATNVTIPTPMRNYLQTKIFDFCDSYSFKYRDETQKYWVNNQPQTLNQ